MATPSKVVELLHFISCQVISSICCFIDGRSGVALVKEANYLPGHMFSPRFLMVHNTRRRREHDVAELT